MRKSRQLTLLAGSGLFHKIWRGHNREHVLEDERDKISYLRDLGETLNEETRQSVVWHSYCVMGNHPHETGRVKPDEHGDLEPGIELLGNWMRNAHSRFGQRYNREHDRQGKVAYDRPKTIPIEDTPEDMQRVMFYGDANPVRAGKGKHPSQYRHSSYRFYAHGEENEFTRHLTPPDWYLAFGDTKEARQKRYRQLCDRYLRETGLLTDEPLEVGTECCTDAISDEGRNPTARIGARARAGPSRKAGDVQGG